MEGSSVNSQTYIKIDSTTVQPLNLVIENTTNEHYQGGVPQTFKIRAKIIDTTVTEDLSFTVLLYPNCANDKVTLTNVQTLASKTVRVESGSEILTFDKPKFDQTYDDDACHFPQEYYSLQQMYHPGPDAVFMPEPFEFTVNVANATNDKYEIGLKAGENSLVKSYASDGTINCDLSDTSDPRTMQCTIDYQILVDWYGSVFTLASGSVTFEHECLSLQNSGTWVPLSADEQKIRSDGYSLRNDTVTLTLPVMNEILGSGNTIFSQCGEISYTVINPDPEIFTINLPSIKDNSEPITIDVYSQNATKITDLVNFDEDFSFILTVALNEF